MKTLDQIQHIEKEQIAFLNFPKEEVLDKKKEVKDRCQKLLRALRLGNLEHVKVKIRFIDNEGIKEVETTIWGVTSKYVILKKSMVLPLERIISIS
ncbi:hypothetical protein [Aquimarina spongiae]|uniref:Uncharacterized protein n=1 Tax=Aquimarina spongiae TaxID=570521 RepID=A0A1M6EED7_9FLAO|nr:hypothetical protein [Aquimarina spongiae]SHI83834.1 hypothetical protein SAMN04488508_103370 [Aquimarina spongiae]